MQHSLLSAVTSSKCSFRTVKILGCAIYAYLLPFSDLITLPWQLLLIGIFDCSQWIGMYMFRKHVSNAVDVACLD